MKARYRNLTDTEEALKRLLTRAGRVAGLPEETVQVKHACGRITAAPVFAALSAPAYHASAMDGIAVRASDTSGASPTSPRHLSTPDQALPIDTGDPIPEGFDAIIPVELINVQPDGGFVIQQAASPRQHIRLAGEDVVSTEMILPSGRRIRPEHIGAMLGAGVTKIIVRAHPQVAILPTGDELCQPGEDPSDGRVIESNSHLLSALVTTWGGEATRLRAVEDHPGLIGEAMDEALRAGYDVVLVLAGSSAGRDDYTPQVLEERGELLFHGLKLMPGKPTAAGLVDGRPVIGIPGFPVSAVVAAERLLKPLLAQLSGIAPVAPELIQARLVRAVPSRPGQEEVLRVVVGRFADGWVASPLARGAGAITTLSRAHGTIHIPADLEGLPASAEVDVHLRVGRIELENALLFAGSHDMALALLDDQLGIQHPGQSLSVTPLGSMGGLAALARGEAHLAGSHLQDPGQPDQYNLDAVNRVLAGKQVALITLAHRQQGLCTRKDEERKPKDLTAVIEQGMRFVNRQPGSGTRVLVDNQLQRQNLSHADLLGYDHQEHTHVAVAEAVRSRAADCGMAIRAAAEARGLDFVPLTEERYDLVIPREAFQDERIRALIAALADPAFQRRVADLPGYDTRETGQVRCLPEGSWTLTY